MSIHAAASKKNSITKNGKRNSSQTKSPIFKRAQMSETRMLEVQKILGSRLFEKTFVENNGPTGEIQGSSKTLLPSEAQERIDTTIATNDILDVVNGLGAKQISQEEASIALRYLPKDKNPTSVSLGTRRALEVYIESDKLSNVKHGDLLFGRRVEALSTSIDAGEVTGIHMSLLPDSFKGTAPLRALLQEFEIEAELLREHRNDIQATQREQKDLFIATGELGVTIKKSSGIVDPVTGEQKSIEVGLKVKGTTEGSLTFTVGNKIIAFDSKGRVGAEAGALKAKAPLGFVEDAGPKVDLFFVSTEGEKIFFGGGKKFRTRYGDVTAKVQLGVNIREAGERLSEPARQQWERVEILNDLIDQIDDVDIRMESIKYQINHFIPKLKPIDLYIKVPK